MQFTIDRDVNNQKASTVTVDLDKKILQAWGLISRNLVSAAVKKNQGQGIRFIYKDIIVEALSSNITSTQRNTVIGKSEAAICLTEHFLAACALTGITNIDLDLSEQELPFADGSAMFWVDFFNTLDDLDRVDFKQRYNLKEEIVVEDGDRCIKIIPAENFQISYHLDWQHPKIGQQEYTWSLGDDINELARARTFSNEMENQMLGLSGWVIGLTEDGITEELYYPDEPARHKTLDLLGDLSLSGINPLQLNAHIISNKGGHTLNSKAARILNEVI